MRWRWIVGLVAVMMMWAAAPVQANDWDLTPNPEVPGVDLGGEEEVPGGPGSGPGPGDPSGPPADPNVQYRWVLHPSPCAAPRVWYHQERRDRTGGAWGEWESTGQTTGCIEPEEAPEEELPQITPEMIRDRARALAPVPVVSIEPATRTFVNIPTNFSAPGGGATRTVEILGRSVTITFTETSTTWNFGDGSTGTGDGVAGASVGQAGAVEHLYRRGGSVSVTASRSFAVSAQVPGAGTITLDEPIVATSAPYALAVGEIQSLVTGAR